MEPRNVVVTKIFFSIAVLTLAIGSVFWKDVFSQLFITLLFIAMLPWLVPFLAQHLRTAELLGAKLEFHELEKRIEKESLRVDELFLLSMGKHAFTQLDKLNSGNFGSYEIGAPLERELAHLDNLGYIRYKGSLKGLDDFLRLGDGTNMSDHIELTENGKKYLELRRSLPPPDAVSLGKH